MRRKHLQFTDFQGRQLQDLLDSHLGVQLTPQTRAVVQSEGRTINIWVLAPAADGEPAMRAPLPPVTAPAPTVAATGRSTSAAYEWQTPAETADDLLALTGNPLGVLSAAAVRTAAATPGWSRFGLSSHEFDLLRQALTDCQLPAVPSHTPDHASLNGASVLREWLWSHRRSSRPLTRAVAAAVACASFSNQPLWVDLGLSGRDPLNALLNGHFPALYRLNTTHMGWKKFFLLKLPGLLPAENTPLR